VALANNFIVLASSANGKGIMLPFSSGTPSPPTSNDPKLYLVAKDGYVPFLSVIA
jgi:Tol biopolymer transport system component